MSPKSTVIRSIGMPRRSLATIAQDVWWPCPCGVLPLKTVTVPSGFIRTMRGLRPVRRAGDLDVARHADAELLGVAGGATALLLGAHRCVVDGLERAVERRLVLARVVDRAHRSGERERVGLR